MDNRIVILGGGESGIGSAILAKQKGYDVFLSDAGLLKEKYKSTLSIEKIAFEENTHTIDKILSAKEIIKSPGIPESNLVVSKALELKIPVISEIEFASRYTNAKKICITGTNGKTTTTYLTYHILKNAGLNVGLAGNVGKSFALQVAKENFDYYVLELSSFQLDGMFEFRADISVLLNITPDHLDRYDNKFENYIKSKFRIIQNQTSNEFFIFNYDDETIKNYMANWNSPVQLVPFSLQPHQLTNGAFLENNQITIKYKTNQNPLIMTIEQLALQGRHNVYNSMAASLASKIVDVRNDVIKESLMNFQGVEHRLENVANVNGIEFINDSKATNINSAWYALESMEKPVVWICGGQDKGNNYEEILDLVKHKVKAIVCLGKNNKKIISAFKDTIELIVETDNAMDAVAASYKIAKNGDVVLLSPACASFDLFESYEDRGMQFKAAVKSL
ncbi:MAG: UDP-N-acetylmuramoyl-L-alanine--D-glutamate ligase [Bacteroidia bacterium]